MLSLLDLPDEILLRILAWIPYRSYAHTTLHLVNHRFHVMMQTASLPGMIAWYQFSPFMSLLQGYRRRTISQFSWDELLQTTKSVAMHRDWIVNLQELTGFTFEACFTLVSIVHFIAAANKRILNGRNLILQSSEGLWEATFFLVATFQALPNHSLLLLRHIIRKTMNDIHDRHMPFDLLKFFEEQTMSHCQKTDSDVKHFSLTCILEADCLLLGCYRPFYNIMADESFYQYCIRVYSDNAVVMLDTLLNHSLPAVDHTFEALFLGAFALHKKLVEFSKEGEFLGPVEIGIPADITLSERLSLEYHKMKLINTQIDDKFNDPDAAALKLVSDLDLESIGRTLSMISKEQADMSAKMRLEKQKTLLEEFMLDQWLR